MSPQLDVFFCHRHIARRPSCDVSCKELRARFAPARAPAAPPLCPLHAHPLLPHVLITSVVSPCGGVSWRVVGFCEHGALTRSTHADPLAHTTPKLACGYLRWTFGSDARQRSCSRIRSATALERQAAPLRRPPLVPLLGSTRVVTSPGVDVALAAVVWTVGALWRATC